MTPKKLITHDGSFHTDDVFACAALSLMLEKQGEKFEIIRTRDPEIIKNGDYVFDVGGFYDEGKNKFDHHQISGAGRRTPSGNEGQEGIEYSSFGLVWKKFGEKLSGSGEAAELVDRRLVSPIDAHDNGFDLVEKKYDVFPYLIQDFFRVMRPTWREEDVNINEMFFESVLIAKKLLLREITHAKDTILSNQSVISIYNSTKDKSFIILDKNYPSSEILNKLPEVFFVVYPAASDGSWRVKAVRNDSKSFKNRKDFPASWAGLRDEELQKITGVPDAVFCHRALFMAVAKSKEGAISLAQKALVI
ncbi:hypothetical protein A3C67_00120 [Candidatus Nomurabacteria bacterium RIFCSPHIGHO2_02_FULL_42_19]|uniref:Metal-dependent hydrolase n=1 Tax=Candidatus Nomurabacteria bacterium RIFCSPHIGHO2_02_FULL_42_19 TaxID=1801756 RepID=A0A1F6W3L4_9BACT|nr:MAG: hypothetical protein A3C67_00120 [Candidatus Nomurabacteria bacterium RIFCSPHIGHO2_02_FULL_42_19]